MRRRQPQGRRHPCPYPNNSRQGGTTPSSQPIYRWEGVVGVGAGMSRRHPNARGWAIRAANVSGAPRARAAFPGEPPRWRLSQSTPPSRQCRSGSHRRKSFKKQAKTSYQGKNDVTRVIFGYTGKKGCHILSISCRTFCVRKVTDCAIEFGV